MFCDVVPYQEMPSGMIISLTDEADRLNRQHAELQDFPFRLMHLARAGVPRKDQTTV